MKIDEFMEEIKKIENYYQKEMTDEQKKIWFDNLKNMNIARFKYIIANLFRTSKFIPKLADVYELNSSLGVIKREEQKKNCPKCNNTGYIIYKKPAKDGEIETEYGAICSCKRQTQYKGWEINDEAHRTEFYTPLVEELTL